MMTSCQVSSNFLSKLFVWSVFPSKCKCLRFCKISLDFKLLFNDIVIFVAFSPLLVWLDNVPELFF